MGVFPCDKRGVGEAGGPVLRLGEETVLHIHWLTSGEGGTERGEEGRRGH